MCQESYNPYAFAGIAAQNLPSVEDAIGFIGSEADVHIALQRMSALYMDSSG